ncbi:unnamed protein product [Prorocentrum cordatum]|uniref:Phospholipase B-like n=1 Tax=Prorocentrum cordatum TaxID=2364126 RepID=A0ABN9W1F1_9DINO|nr:unnamed protein product [Polarella glacialis]
MVAPLLLALCAPMAGGIALHSDARHAGGKADGFSSALSQETLDFFRHLENASSRRPAIMPPGDVRRAWQSRHTHGHANGDASLLDLADSDAFQPSDEFQRAGEEQGEGSELPWGIGMRGDSKPLYEYSAMPTLDVPHYVEYSLESGNNIQTFSSAWQDVKLITQVLENVTNGFYLDTHGGDGETNSYTLLLELTGWRGLIIEPLIYNFANLWGKLRKAWIFLGCVSPTWNATQIGFDTEGVIDMESGHFVPAYNIPAFMEELGGRKTIDFWAVHNGHYEAEVLNETFLYSGKNIEFGVVLVRFDGRRTGRGYQFFAQHRSKDATEELIFEIMRTASFNYIGGLDAYWINYVEPRFGYMDHVWVNPAYFERRGLPVPSWCKSAPPPKLEYTDQKAGAIPWDAGYTYKEEVNKVMAYMANAKRAAAATESAAQAHRVVATELPSVKH